MVATGAWFLARQTTADLTEAHKQTRVELGRDLLQVDPNVIIFTDESPFDCSDVTCATDSMFHRFSASPGRSFAAVRTTLFPVHVATASPAVHIVYDGI
jgi:hypothetical protein